ncbi:hypothetical protein ACO22_03246 [Paracoccidioides brasiliensis]|uniref:Protein PXR1 n=1 Tax=Paracoccidioides brasiliensis TaxID=121759 RepID=A0A1D2JGG1_PARBR|nr:hypothetical protein ACO22_03246 [Paracoccidioides brasiliensis]ODH47196.1 hypothetical protein GX48_06711 [Paracoccidioides brasiliensis]
MGLAGPRKRTKISHDPNNTAWARSTSGFGHKIMSAHGWTPGSFLGASNAAHAEHFTSASAGHIRVILKDDNLGLGAKPRAGDEPTGLDAFQGLLGRLNGKSGAELEIEQRKRDDRRLANFVEKRWKTMRFVSGGLLVHEKIQALTEVQSGSEGEAEEAQENSKSETLDKTKKERKRERKSKGGDSNSDVSQELSKKNEKKLKMEKKKKTRSGDYSSPSTDTTTSLEDALINKKRKKSKKRKQQDLEFIYPEERDSNGADTQSSVGRDEEKSTSTISNHTHIVKVKEHRPLGRQFTRGRYIQQKKLALMDAKSLSEIFMVK